MKSLVPASSTFSGRNSNVGVEIKPTILEKQKYEHHKNSIEVNPNLATGSIKFIENNEFKQTSLTSTFESIKEGSHTLNIIASSSFDLPLSQSISLGNAYVTSSGYLKNSPAKNHFHPPFLQPGGYSASIDYPLSASSISIPPITTGSGVVFPKSGSNNYFSTHYNKSFKNIHDDWGTGAEDVRFINFAEPGTDGLYNTYHIEKRFHFISIGDMEFYSGSKTNDDFTDHRRFLINYSRLSFKCNL